MIDRQINRIRYYRARCIERYTAGVARVRADDPAIGALIDRYLAYAHAQIVTGGAEFECIDEGADSPVHLPCVVVYAGRGWTRAQVNRWLHRTVRPFRKWVDADSEYAGLFRWDGKLRVIDGGRDTDYLHGRRQQMRGRQ